MDQRMVSICIPTYNSARYLRECLDSALEQTYRDIEVLVVDNASTDETVSIVRHYAQRDPRIQLTVNQYNLGLVGNLKRCVELARGEWVKFLFSDDTLERECVERMVRAAHPSGPPMIACRRAIIFEDAYVSPETRRFYAKHDGEESLQGAFAGGGRVSAQDFCEVVLDHMGQNFVGEPTSVLLRRTVFDDFGGFNPDLITTCDLEYWIRVGINAGLLVVPEVLATFRVHSHSISATSMATRKYRMYFLEPVILFHEFVYHPAFSPLRDAAAERRPPLDLKRMFAEFALRARKQAKLPSDGDGSSSRWQEWGALASRYPKIERSLPIAEARARHLGSRILRRITRLPSTHS